MIKIILSILVVAILIVAIVGATFAFFSASGGSANNAVRANATTLANLGFTSSNSKIATNLVPVESEHKAFRYYPGTSASGCIDDVGNEICSVYEFTVTNTASVAQTIYVSFVPSQNTFDNMYFAAFNRAAASADYTVATGSGGSGNSFTLTSQTTSGNLTLGHTATKLTKNSVTEIDMPGLTTTLSAGSSVTYTILVWLQDIGTDQNQEQGGSFAAGVNVTTGTNSSGVTGVLGARNPYVYTVSTTTASIGEPIPNGMTTYSTASSAMAEFGHDFFIRHKIENDVITESYVGLVRNGTTYYLKGGDNGTSYSTNVGTLTTAFGISYCYGDTSYLGCGASGLHAHAYDAGSVDAGDDVWSCRVFEGGVSSCYEMGGYV